MRTIRNKKSPCFKCERQGCGSYHDICPEYNDWLRDGISINTSPVCREYIPKVIWRNRGSIGKKMRGLQ